MRTGVEAGSAEVQDAARVRRAMILAAMRGVS